MKSHRHPHCIDEGGDCKDDGMMRMRIFDCGGNDDYTGQHYCYLTHRHRDHLDRDLQGSNGLWGRYYFDWGGGDGEDGQDKLMRLLLR
jgi:hypothetical protein